MNKFLTATFVSYLLAFTTLACDTPKNIILMIGDGMGPAQLTAGLITKGELNMERMEVGGMVKTFSANNLITDSAAGGTALATGEKTKNGTISQSLGGRTLKTLFEHAEEKGKATGVAVTCSVTHATPASFMAHVQNRGMNAEIADQIAASETDVIFGGGLKYFKNDERDLLEKMKKKGLQIAVSEQEFMELGNRKKAVALIADEHPEPSEKRAVKLADMTRKALSILSRNKKGFVLMVEGSQIDWAGHANDAVGLIREMKEFDDTVGVALDFAEKEGDTLVIVTADHETGGYTIQKGSREDREVTEAAWSTRSHTATMVPILASGPGACCFGGIIDNTYIGKQLINIVNK